MNQKDFYHRFAVLFEKNEVASGFSPALWESVFWVKVSGTCVNMPM